jgi:flagellar biosynthesis repressor protein FlbT
MKKSMHISLRAGERIYINGAVLRVDRKVTLELLNDAAFLLENQVMQYEQAVTPLRQLYFIVQLMLIEPSQALAKSEPFKQQLIAVLTTCKNVDIIDDLRTCVELVGEGRYHETLKTIRALFPMENAVMGNEAATKPIEAA